MVLRKHAWSENTNTGPPSTAIPMLGDDPRANPHHALQLLVALAHLTFFLLPRGVLSQVGHCPRYLFEVAPDMRPTRQPGLGVTGFNPSPSKPARGFLCCMLL